MPIIYLSPSTQENNLYVSGGTEEEWMNRLADAMEPYLTASGIRYSRNTPDMTAASSIRASNAGTYDLHLALHSNAAPEGIYGQVRGVLVFYYPGSTQGKRAAELIANGLKTIYPLPNKVRAEPTTTIGEVKQVRAPAVFLELGYHDNPDDAAWVKGNLDAIARNLVLSLTEFFGLPFLEPQNPRPAVVDVNWGYLNLRDRPSVNAPVLARAYDGTALTVLNQWEEWYVVRLDGLVGWANERYITLL
ncbi:N-acetylmuramoyl-L-alanine amidase [Pseudoflavonifractor phocaeensis]|uniref:N-acetylmuramoyl-L-alanine amidase n=1 Tax=Pseudoflavonifractor phocaeensis TaxID=1870988 RepID=UPI00195E3C56|nr:N-acetylmuramoyl-L-alanine amidase [Pseudoflavonifractor phocaeensis]MBM6924333.1 N-acetylmuramoyl-L-alanine amidase [Pseudoflavonifractor phocaeensis]